MKKFLIILAMAMMAATLFPASDALAWNNRGGYCQPRHHGYYNGHRNGYYNGYYRGGNIGEAFAAGAAAGAAAGLVEGTIRALTSPPPVVVVAPAPAMCLRNGVYVPCDAPPAVCTREVTIKGYWGVDYWGRRVYVPTHQELQRVPCY